MNKKFPVFDSGRDFGQEFMDYYSKDIQCPTTRLLFSCFHPVLKDHHIPVNRICFPKVNADQIVALHHDRQSKHLTEKLNFHYNTKSNERNTRERIRLSNANSFRNNSGDSSVPEIFDSFELNERSMLLEGGDNENIKSKRSRSHIKIQDQSSTIVIDSRNRINISVPPRLKGKHPKIKSKNSLREKLARENENSKTFSEAVDSYVDQSSLFSYKTCHELLKPRVFDYDPDCYLNEGDDHRIDEYTKDRPKDQRVVTLEYTPIPSVNGLRYIPPPFRYKYEICIWKVEVQNAAKIKHKYFSPEIMSEKKLDNTYFEFRLSIDKKILVMNEYIYLSNGSSLVLTFDVNTLEKISEFYVNTCNPSLALRNDYEKYADIYDSKTAKYNKTNYFRRITCWNNGKYILVSVGAKPKSQIYPELRAYDVDYTKVVASFNRKDHALSEITLENTKL